MVEELIQNFIEAIAVIGLILIPVSVIGFVWMTDLIWLKILVSDLMAIVTIGVYSKITE